MTGNLFLHTYNSTGKLLLHTYNFLSHDTYDRATVFEDSLRPIHVREAKVSPFHLKYQHIKKKRVLWVKKDMYFSINPLFLRRRGRLYICLRGEDKEVN